MAVREIERDLVLHRRETQEVEQAERLVAQRGLLTARLAGPQEAAEEPRLVVSVEADEHVVEGRHAAERHRMLKDAADAQSGDLVGA